MDRKNQTLRDFEIRTWFYCLRKIYVKEGMAPINAGKQAYEDLTTRFFLQENSLRKIKNRNIPKSRDREYLLFEVKNNLQKLKKIIAKIEKAIEEY